MATSSIEWTESTWNPITGCTKISPGCQNCYAERMALRLRAMGQDNYRNGFDITLHERTLPLPLQWKKPRVVFVNSMSDLFHEKVPFAFIKKVFSIMEKASWHTFQVLTKRAERLASVCHDLPWPGNVWMGVSVESNEYKSRIDSLRTVPAKIRFISMEPLLRPVSSVKLDGIDWVIVGGESGPGARPMHSKWVQDICAACEAVRVPFFFKQWGGVNKKKAGRLLNDRIYNEMPLRPSLKKSM